MEIYKKFLCTDSDLDAKPMFRWWFPDASAKHEKIRAQMKEMYDGGFGGVEVAFSPQFTEFDAYEYGWGTPRWKEIVREILKTALSFPEGFKVDFHFSAHWPHSVNTICPNDDLQVQELVGAFQKLPKTSCGMCRVPMPEIKMNDHDSKDAADYIFENKFVGMSAARVIEIRGTEFVLDWDSAVDLTEKAVIETNSDGSIVWTPAGIPLHENHFGNWPKLRDRQLYYMTNTDELPASNNNDEAIQPGDWILFGIWRRGSGQTISGRNFEIFSLKLPVAPKCYTLNYWETGGAEQLIRFWEKNILNDEEIVSLLKEEGRLTGSCFKGGGLTGETNGRWTRSMPSDFRTNRGYSLMPYLPFLAFHDYHIPFSPYQYKYTFVGDKGQEKRLFEDYFKVCVQLQMERADKPLLEWAKTYCYGVRAKNYAPLKEGSTSAMELTQAEGATLDLRMKMDNFRDVSSGVHLSDRNIIAAEANADELMPYRLTFKNVCEKLNQCYTAGMNLAIFHGASFDEEYSGKFSQWPGWHCFQFSFAGAWGRRHPWWGSIHNLSDYLCRVQGCLQSGQARVDFLVYEPFRYVEQPEFGSLLSSGYSYDCGGDTVLERFWENKDKIPSNSYPGYKAVVMRGCHAITLDALAYLIDISRNGFPVICVGELPERVYGLPGSRGETDESICRAVQQLKIQKEFYQVLNEKELVEKFLELDIKPRIQIKSEGIRCICREDENSEWFYIYNASCDNTATIKISPEGKRKAYVADPWNGMCYIVNSNEINMLPGEARFLVYADSGVMDDDVQEYCIPGKLLQELEHFSLTIDSWGPADSVQDPCLSKHTELHLGEVPLDYWDTLEAPPEELAADGVESMYHVSGIGQYRTEFESEKEQDVFLVTTGGEEQVVEIKVNDKIQPLPDAIARFGPVHLSEGKNVLEIKVASTLRRRVNKENPYFTENDFEIMFSNIENYGNARVNEPEKMNRYGLTSVKLYTVER